MKRLVLSALTIGLLLSGCQSKRAKEVAQCIDFEPRYHSPVLTPNDIRNLCECWNDRFRNQDGNTSLVDAYKSCYSDLELDKKAPNKLDGKYW